ncbi:transcription elongation factor GreA [Candidatus Peregrinibacteria bacterium]|nr:transcription elongation factor GreA [Candidatus Peregrinibacteria bacterium]
MLSSDDLVVTDQKVATDDKKTVLVTRDGLKKLREELDYLKDVRRKEIAERLKEAISYGDLSENSEYEEAKNEQAFMEGRIFELEEKIKYAQIIEAKHQKGRVVQLGALVRLRDLSSNKEEEYTMVGSTEADSLARRVSNDSPIGKVLMEKKVGDVVSYKAPGGKFQYKIVGLK